MLPAAECSKGEIPSLPWASLRFLQEWKVIIPPCSLLFIYSKCRPPQQRKQGPLEGQNSFYYWASTPPNIQSGLKHIFNHFNKEGSLILHLDGVIMMSWCGSTWDGGCFLIWMLVLASKRGNPASAFSPLTHNKHRQGFISQNVCVKILNAELAWISLPAHGTGVICSMSTMWMCGGETRRYLVFNSLLGQSIIHFSALLLSCCILLHLPLRRLSVSHRSDLQRVTVRNEPHKWCLKSQMCSERREEKKRGFVRGAQLWECCSPVLGKSPFSQTPPCRITWSLWVVPGPARPDPARHASRCIKKKKKKTCREKHSLSSDDWNLSNKRRYTSQHW